MSTRNHYRCQTLAQLVNSIGCLIFLCSHVRKVLLVVPKEQRRELRKQEREAGGQADR